MTKKAKLPPPTHLLLLVEGSFSDSGLEQSSSLKEFEQEYHGRRQDISCGDRHDFVNSMPSVEECFDPPKDLDQ
jgi:hypothetical protein